MQAFFEKLFSGFYRGHPLYGSGFIEIRAWPSVGEKIPHRRFYPNIQAASKAVEALRASPEKLNIFFGVVTCPP